MNKYPNLDAGVLEIASFTDLPKQRVRMNPATSFLGQQVQQLKVRVAQPSVDSQAPVRISRRPLGGGQFQFRVQFIAPTAAQDPDYQGTSILIATPNGTQRLAASAGKGPIVFTSSQSTAPSSVVVQQDNVNGSSDTGLGGGSSRPLLLLPT